MISYSICDSTRSPLKGIDITKLFKKSKARRALLELGINDPIKNYITAKQITTITQEQFARKWNFDPVLGKPIENGDYDWTPCTDESTNIKCNTYSLNQKSVNPMIETSSTTNSLSSIQSHPSEFEFRPLQTSSPQLPRKIIDGRLDSYLGHSCDTSSCKRVCPIPRTPKKTPVKTLSSKYPTTPRSLQRKITDFGKQRKRLHSITKTDESEDLRTPSKKRIALEFTSPSK